MATASTFGSFLVTSEADAIFPLQDGECTYREAVINADAGAILQPDCADQGGAAGEHVITFDGSVATVDLVASFLPIDSALPIRIDGGGDVIIDGQGQHRPFNIEAGAEVTLESIRIDDADDPSAGGAITSEGEVHLIDVEIYLSSSGERGGAIHNTGTLTVTGGQIDSNTAETGGGAIYNDDGTVTLDRVGIEANTSAGDNGGAILTTGGELTVRDSVIEMNTGGYGGGIAGVLGPGTVSIEDSRILNNTATIGGGGINVGFFESLTILRSTIAGNSTPGLGGGIGNGATPLVIADSTFSGNDASNGAGVMFSSGDLSITNSTFSGNTATMQGGGLYLTDVFPAVVNITNVTFARNSGEGAIYNNDVNPANITNSIIANQQGATTDCAGGVALVSGGHNLDSDGSCGFAATGDISSGSANVGGLADNGGSTETHALLAGSDAIDAGDDTICIADPVNGIDQRGVTRLHGSHCDIGAYEFESGTPTPTVPPTSTPTGTPAATETATPTSTPIPSETATSAPSQSATASSTAEPTETPAGTERVWADVDCSGELTARDNQAELRFVLSQPPLGQTEPCPDIGDTVSVDGTQRIWGDDDCSGAISARDNQAKLRFILDQAPLSQTEPCPDVAESVQVSS